MYDEKSVERQRKILELLIDGPKTREFLMKVLGVEIRSLQEDIKKLNLYGCGIPSHSKKNGGYIIAEENKPKCEELLKKYNELSENGMTKLVNVEGKTLKGEDISADEIYAYKQVKSSNVDEMIIISVLQKSDAPITINELTEKYLNYIDSNRDLVLTNYKKAEENKSRIMKIKKLCKMLIEEGLVLYDAEKKLYSVTKDIPVLLKLDDTMIEYYMYAIRAFGSVYALRDVLLGIEEKLKKCVKEPDPAVDSGYIIVGNRINDNHRSIMKLQDFHDIPYERYAIRISVKDKAIKVLVGLMVYVVDKDKLYIIGKAGEKEFRIIDVEDIDGNIELTNELNNIYGSEEYVRIFREMFSISTEPLEHVKVEVKNFGNLVKKFETLCKRRNHFYTLSDDKKARIYKKDENTFIYEDDIRGMSDFAKYLRRHGSSVKVIEPEKLKKMMMNSVTRMEMVYRKEGLYEKSDKQ